MIYYERHLGDYARDTGHLSLLEHGVYSVLLDRYYSTEAPIPAEQVYRIARARSEDERAAVDAVLAEFFTLDGDGWRSARCDAEIERYAGRREKARKSAEARWGGCSKDANASAKHSERNANASPEHSEGNAIQSPSTKEEAKTRIRPTTVAEPESPDNPASVTPLAESAAASDAVVDRVLAEYATTLPDCQRVSVLTAKRRRLVLAADKLARRFCRERGLDYGPAFWSLFWAECAEDEWLAGRKPNPNNPAWKQSIDVLLREDTIARVLDAVVSRKEAA